MKRLLLPATMVIALHLLSTVSKAQASSGIPNPHAHSKAASVVPNRVQNAFDEMILTAGMFLLSDPVWMRQNGLCTVSFRAENEFGAGTWTMRFKPAGGLVLIAFSPDEISLQDE